MDAERPLLAFGSFNRAQRSQLAVAAAESAFRLEVQEDPTDAARWLSAERPAAILLDCEREDAEAVALEARAQVENARVPILGLSDTAADLSFADVFTWGGDDLVSLSKPFALTRRLRALPRTPLPPPANGRGTAVVADSDRRRRTVLGRVLRNAGYRVSFAVNVEDGLAYACDEATTLVVASHDLDSDAAMLATRARAGGSKALWITAAPPRSLRDVRLGLSTVEHAAAIDSYSPPENVVFLANELAHGRGHNQRSSARLLYGVTCAFRGAGRPSDELGYTYNISAGGLYVRTLAPPEDDEVWVELSPPRTEKLVRLVGSVVWRRTFGAGTNATVPPGFGVKILDGARMDIEAYESGYAALAEMLG